MWPKNIKANISRNCTKFQITLTEEKGVRVVWVVQWLGYGLDNVQFISQQRQIIHPDSRVHPASYSIDNRVLSLGYRARVWSQPSAKVKSEGSCTSVPLMCFYGVDRDNLTFTFTHVKRKQIYVHVSKKKKFEMPYTSKISSLLWRASSLLCFLYNGKELSVVIHTVKHNYITSIITMRVLTMTCFSPTCGPSSGCN